MTPPAVATADAPRAGVPAAAMPDDGARPRADDEVLGRWLLRRLRSWWPVLAVAVAIGVAGALTATQPDPGLPLDPVSRRPDGTAALVDVLTALDRPPRVVDPARIGDAEVVLLLRDQLTGAQRRDLRDRVRAGARVIVTDPTSPLAPATVGDGGLRGRVRDRDCAVAALRAVDRVSPGGGGALYEVPDRGTACFVDGDGAWLVVTPLGDGEIVALGGPGVVVNSRLGATDNAVLAVQLLTPVDAAGPAAIVRPLLRAPGEGGPTSLSALVPWGVRVAVLQLLVAFGVVVMWRARRLGRPLVDGSPVRLASAELTTAVGALFARNEARAAAARRIAVDTRRRLARRLNLPSSADAFEVASAVAERTGGDVDRVVALLDPPPPSDDADLLARTSALATLERTVHATTTPHGEPADVN